jgi:hypothetical protein
VRVWCGAVLCCAVLLGGLGRDALGVAGRGLPALVRDAALLLEGG